MFNRGYILSSQADFDNARWAALHIEVWQNGRMIDDGGRITVITKDSVQINDGKFLRDVCQFRVR